MSTESPHRVLREVGGVELKRAADRIVSLLRKALASRLVAVYVIGSLATGDAHPAVSDLDLIVVVDSVIVDDTLVRIGEQLAEAAAEVPMRGLEAVVYRADVLAAPSYPLTIELNVNAGAELERVVATRTDEPFWFLLDVAAARDAALVLHGPPPREVIGDVHRDNVVAALRDSVRWHRRDPRSGPDTVLNLARTWRWLEEGDWASKTQAGRWALDHTREPDVVAAALASRMAGSDAELDPEALRRLEAEVAALLDADPA